MFYDIKVNPPQGDGSAYIETIEADTQSEATLRVQRANPGCNVYCVGNRASNNSSGGGFDFGFDDGTKGLIVFGLLILFFIVKYWYIAIPVGLIVSILLYFGLKDD